MPLFEYACPDCGHVFERLVLARSAEPPECPKCGRDGVEQIFSAFATASGKGKASGTVCAPSGGG
jgi:putative FmdB family regulatory protein